MSELITANERAGRLSFTGEIREGGGAQAVFICVGTPTMPADGGGSMRYVYQAARGWRGDRRLRRRRQQVDVADRRTTTRSAASSLIRVPNPSPSPATAEFLREGAAIDDFKQPDRVVIGVEDDAARGSSRRFTSRFEAQRQSDRLHDAAHRRIGRSAVNVFLAMKVTFINEMADLCEKVGGDVMDVAHGVGLDKRIGRRLLNPAPVSAVRAFRGYAGVDQAGDRRASPMRLVETLVDVNDKRKVAMAGKIVAPAAAR